MKLGFIGTGVITEAVITGLMKAGANIEEIVVSPRNAQIASRLAEAYPVVRVAADNQAVVDAVDMVFLAIRPQLAEAVVTALRFREDQQVVSLVATVSVDTLAGWIGMPLTITRAIPLPFVADLRGATVIYPPDAQVAALFSALGTAIQAEDLRQFDLLAAASALMGSYFGMLETCARWLEGEGLPYGPASDYLRQLHIGLAHAMAASPSASFDTLRQDHSTRGGLNEQVFAQFDVHGGNRALCEALDSVLARIRQP